MYGVVIYDPAKGSREYRHIDPKTGRIVPTSPERTSK